MPPRPKVTQINRYWDFRAEGYSYRESASKAGFSPSYASTLERNRKIQGPTDERGRQQMLRDPLAKPELGPEALRALGDFAYFQQRYFGRIPFTWQVEAANRIVAALSSADKEYFVVNCPPGVGKTTLFTHDIPAWMVVRNRGIRMMMGAATTDLATRYTNRLRKTLSRTLPEKAKDDDLARGYAVDAEATLAGDFGRFQPIGDTWTKDSWVVQQYVDDGPTSEKEPTCSAYGMDAGFIGGRFDFVVWDDLVDPKKQKTFEAKQDLQNNWDDVSEPRLEPGGLLILQGQRLSSDDLYRYCLNKIVAEDEDPETGEQLGKRPKYQHIIYKAHYEENCKGPETHRRDSPGWPEGCLLSPWRLPWREVNALMSHKIGRFQVVYQQQDMDPESVLVPPAWIHGHDGHPGCTDPDRDRLELPKGLAGDLFSVITVDPSPTRYWAIQWWIYQPATEYRWLMDLVRQPMDADEFLDFDHNARVHTGLLEEWWQTSADLGLPVTHVVFEINAAQRFLLQYQHVRTWMALRGVEIVPHSTHKNKADPEYGVDSIRQHYKYGRIRLPYKRDSQGFICSSRLIDEVTQYPHGSTDDNVMAHWFLEWQLPNIYNPDEVTGALRVPSWARDIPDVPRRPQVDSGHDRLFSGVGL